MNRKATKSEKRTEAFQRLTRRTFAVSGAVAVLPLAGCADSQAESEHTDDSAVEINETPTDANTEQAFQAFSERVTEENITVESVSYNQDESRVKLTYHSADPASSETVTTEIGTITGEFYNSLDAGLTVDRLNATVLGPKGSERITWHAERAWYRDFQEGEIAASDLTLRVVETAKEKNG